MGQPTENGYIESLTEGSATNASISRNSSRCLTRVTSSSPGDGTEIRYDRAAPAGQCAGDPRSATCRDCGAQPVRASTRKPATVDIEGKGPAILECLEVVLLEGTAFGHARGRLRPSCSFRPLDYLKDSSAVIARASSLCVSQRRRGSGDSAPVSVHSALLLRHVRHSFDRTRPCWSRRASNGGRRRARRAH